MTPAPNKLAVYRFALAALAVFLATYVRVAMTPIIQDRMPFSTYTIAVMLVAWLGGVWPASLALALSTLCAAHFVVPPEGTLNIANAADQLALLVFFVVGVVSIVVFHRLDYQRRRAVEQSLQNEQLNCRLRELDERKDEFISLLAHELRTPMAPIGNALALTRQCMHQYSNDHNGPLTMQRTLEDSVAEISHSLDIVYRHFRHLTRLVDDLLDVSRYLRGSIAIRPKRVRLMDCIGTALESCQSQIDTQGHELFLDLQPESITLTADPERLCQIVANLVFNAAKYTPEHGRILVSAREHGRHVEITVQDNGIGIQNHTREKIFEPFFQANSKQSRFASGLGLGLSIVKRLVELHDGKITVDSDGLNSGSRFTVLLPTGTEATGSEPTPTAEPIQASACAERSDQPIPGREQTDALANRQLGVDVADQQTAAGSVAAAAGGMKKKRILIIDDDVDTVSTLNRLIQLEGFVTETATSGLLALKTLRSFEPDIVLLDIGLPELDGYEIAKRLRCNHLTRQATIIAISGWGSEKDLIKGKQAGFDFHLVKPVDVPRLFKCLNQIEAGDRALTTDLPAHPVLQSNR